MSKIKYSDYKWLFTSDKDQRGNFFSKLFIKNLSNAINENPADILAHPAALRVMTSLDYEVKAPGMRDNDIHYEFTDFIIKTALFHRKIDPSVFARGAIGAPLPANLLPYTTLQDPDARIVYEQVYKRWDQLSDETKNFYDTFLALLHTTDNINWLPVDPIDYTRDITGNYQLYRLNFKKSARYDPPFFMRIIPKWYQDYSPNIWYSQYTGSAAVGGVPTNTPTQINPTVPVGAGANIENFFQDLYTVVYHHALIPPLVAGAPWVGQPNPLIAFMFPGWGINFSLPDNYQGAKLVHPNIFFDIDVDKFIRELLSGIAKAEIVEPTPSCENADFDFITGNHWYLDLTTNSYYRVENIDGKPTKVPYGLSDPAGINLLKKNNSCASTGVSATGADCRNYIINCILADNKDDFTSCMLDNKDFYKSSVDEIKNTHPLMALETLRKFGFRKHWVYDSIAGTKILKVESLAHWIKNFLPTKFPAADIQESIRTNENLLTYLRLLSEYVNSNPGILNKSYQGTTEEKKGLITLPAYPKALNMKLRRDPPVSSPLYDLGLFKKQLELYKYLRRPGFTMSPYGLNSPFGSNIIPGFAMNQFQMGGNLKCDQILKTDQNFTHLVQMVKHIFNDLYDQLKSRGKTISHADRDCITTTMENIYKLSHEVQRSICYIDEYNNILESIGDRTSETLSMDKLQEFVNRHGQLLDKSQSEEIKLLSFMEKLQKKLETAEEKTYEDL